MWVLVAAVFAGAIIGVLLIVFRGAIRLFMPRHLHAEFDRKWDAIFGAIGRWIGRALVLFVLFGVGVIVWVANSDDGPPHQAASDDTVVKTALNCDKFRRSTQSSIQTLGGAWPDRPSYANKKGARYDASVKGLSVSLSCWANGNMDALNVGLPDNVALDAAAVRRAMAIARAPILQLAAAGICAVRPLHQEACQRIAEDAAAAAEADSAGGYATRNLVF